jgi:hypothetical protein
MNTDLPAAPAHTPGPWIARYKERPIKGAYPIANVGYSVVWAPNGTDRNQNEEADRALIAAAPDLLDLAHRFAVVCDERLSLLRTDEKDWRADDEWHDMVGHFTALRKRCRNVIRQANAAK